MNSFFLFHKGLLYKIADNEDSLYVQFTNAAVVFTVPFEF